MPIRKALTSWRIRSKLLLLILIVFVPVFGIIVSMGIERREGEISTAKESVLLLAESLGAQQERIALDLEQFLGSLARLPEVRDRDIEGCNELFRGLRERNPSYTIIGLVAPDGILLAASAPFTPGTVNLADRLHIREAIRTRSFSVGEFVVGRVSNVPTLNYTYPLVDLDGNIRSIVVVGYNLDEFMRFIARTKMPEGTSVSILDHAGTRLFRYPRSSVSGQGKPLSPMAFELMNGAEDQGIIERAGDDGTERVYAYKRIRLRDDSPPYLFITVGIPRDSVLKRANLQVAGGLFLLVIVVIVAGGLAWAFGNIVMVRPVSQLVAATRRFGKGEMGVRTELPHTPDELGRLAAAFDEMATLLEERSLERQRAEEELARANDNLESMVAKRTKALEEANNALRQEVAERRRVEARLRESEEIFRLLMLYSPIYIFFKDDRARAINLSVNYEQMLGRSVDELIGKEMEEIFPAELARRMVEDDLSVMRSGRAIERVEELEGRFYTTTKFPIVRDDGSKALAGFTMDITDRVLMERSLRENEQRYRTLFESASDAILLLKDGRIVDCNNRTLALLGAARKVDLLGTRPRDLSPETQPDGRPSEEVLAEHLEAVLDGRSTRFFWRCLRLDGSPLDVQVSLNSLLLDAGRHVQVLARDVTEEKRAEAERRRLEEQLQQARKLEAVGRLAGGVAHDFNNMLGVILGYSELLKARLSGDDPLVEDVEEIERAAMRSRDITKQLLAFSRKQIIEPRPVDLNRMIEGTRKTLFRFIGEDVEFVFHPGENLGTIRIDPSQVDQVLVNLGINARDAMPTGGRLVFETENVFLDESYCLEHIDFKPGYYVLLTVSDEGVGMARGEIEHIFEPFYTTKEVGKGTGLGLATVYGIVRQNGGFINVYSEPGQGTTFRIYFPRMEGEADAGTAPQSPGASRGGATLLLVEDDDMMRRMAAEMLEAMGYTVLVAGSPEEAIILSREEGARVDLLLTDVIMPGMSGKQLAEQVEVILPGIRVLFMSGYTSNVIAHRGVLDEGVQFIQKPFSMDALARKIDATLGRDRVPPEA